MKILAIDSASQGCAVCVLSNGTVCAQNTENMARGQDARLVPMVVSVLKTAGMDFKDLDIIAVTKGPGSFTGLRIGLSAARTFGLSAQKPVVGIDRFTLYQTQFAEKIKSGIPLLILLDSRRAELFGQFCPSDGTCQEPRLWTLDEIHALALQHKDLCLCGDAAALVDLPFCAPSEPEVVTAAKLAAFADINDARYAPRPVYLRAPDVTLNCAADLCVDRAGVE